MPSAQLRQSPNVLIRRDLPSPIRPVSLLKRSGHDHGGLLKRLFWAMIKDGQGSRLVQ